MWPMVPQLLPQWTLAFFARELQRFQTAKLSGWVFLPPF